MPVARSSMPGCKICRGIQKGKCEYCGYVMPKKRDMTLTEIVRVDALRDELMWLRELHGKLRRLNMASTGHFDTDQKIIREIGPWGDLTEGRVLSVEGDLYTVQLESEMVLRLRSQYEYSVGDRVTVRFFGSSPSL